MRFIKISLISLIISALGVCSSFAQEQVSSKNAHSILVESYPSLQVLAKNFNSQELIKSINSALSNIELKHGKRDFSKESVISIVRNLQREHYLLPWLIYSPARDSYKWSENRIDHQTPVDAIYLSNLNIENELIIKALNDSDLKLHHIALEYLLNEDRSVSERKFKTKVYINKKVIRAILQAYEKNYNTPIASLYCSVLRTGKAVECWGDTSISSKITTARFVRLTSSGQNTQQEMDSLFILVWFFGQTPKASVDIVFKQIEAGYPYPYLVKLFKTQDIELIEFFTLHALAGYGVRPDIILRLLSEFPDNLKCLHTLGNALLNRRQGHFSQNAGLIIHLWEKLTGITWNGDDGPFIKWYQMRKKELTEK